MQAEDAEADSYARTARQTFMPNGQTTSECLTRKHCNNVKQLTSLLQQASLRRDMLKPKNETLICELVIEKFSLDPSDYDCRTTQTKLCFIRLPPEELI